MIRSKEFSVIAWSPLDPSQQHCQRVLDEPFEGRQELRTDGAVDGAVIAGERAAHHRCERQRTVLDNRPLLAGADRQDAAMRWIDDRRKLWYPVHSEGGNREGAALKLLELQFAGACAG